MGQSPTSNDSIPNRVAIRTDPDAGNAHRYETIMGAVDALDASSKTKAILAACEHVEQDRRAKERALRRLADDLPPAEVAEIASILSTRHVPLAFEVAYQEGDDEPEIEVGLAED